MTIESLRDILKEENSNSAINGSLAAVFSSVHKIEDRATLDPKLGAIPTLRIADEEEITEKVNTLAELVGEEKFYLKVGGVLYQRGADVGLKPDGLVTKSESEKIEAERILNANIPDLTFMNVLECVFLITILPIAFEQIPYVFLLLNLLFLHLDLLYVFLPLSPVDIGLS